jgi:hypothetical protein
MRWNQGRDIVDRMLAASQLQRVPASRQHADRLILQARKHLASADEISDDDPAGGYTLVYDAARKALTAVLENQGLRPTTRGGHLAVFEATRPPRLQPSSTWASASWTKCRRSSQCPQCLPRLRSST